MNEHAGASCALSVLIVGVFAVLLHPKESLPPGHPQPTKPASKQISTGLATSTRPVADRASTALTTKVIAQPQQTPPITSVSVPGPAAKVVENRSVITPKSKQSVEVAPVKPRAVTAGPKSVVTEVQPGETLADVALRVYGSADRLDELWKANRDQLARADIPLTRGMLLRTP